MVWNNEKDETLCKEVLLFEPFRFKARTKERGNAWKSIAENLNEMKSLHFKVDSRAVRERFGVIQAHYEVKKKEEEKASGIVPEYTEADRAIESIIEKMKEFEKQIESEDNEKVQKNEKDRQTAEDLRQQSLETFAETKKRKQKNGDSDDDASAKGKKARNSGSDTVVYLREKAAKEFELKQQKLELKKKEHENQAAQQKAMYDQQKILYDQQHQMLKNVSDQMMQQQQQNQQMMMMMMQMLQNMNK